MEGAQAASGRQLYSMPTDTCTVLHASSWEEAIIAHVLYRMSTNSALGCSIYLHSMVQVQGGVQGVVMTVP